MGSLLKITQAYVYKWVEISSGKWYIGSRTGKGCHPDDDYICSSRTVRPMISANPYNWKREILCIGQPADMRKLEADLLKSYNAKHDIMSFNMHNGDGKFTTAGQPGTMTGKFHTPEAREKLRYKKTEEHKKKISKTLSGRKNPEHSIKMKGKKHTPESNEKRRQSMLSKGPRGEEFGRKMSEAKKGKPNGLLGTKRKPYKKSKSHEIISCPHCNTAGGTSAMKRWHFDNCKLKSASVQKSLTNNI